jgi:integrase
MDVTRHDVAKLHHDFRETRYQVNRLLAVLSKMFNLAERWGLRPDGSNPCRLIEKFAERKRERMLLPVELARLGDALTSYGGSPYAVTAVKLLVFTGARLGEVLGLKLEWIDFDRGEARLPDSKTGPKTLHLPPPALAVLAALPRLDGNPHVIAGQREGTALVISKSPGGRFARRPGSMTCDHTIWARIRKRGRVGRDGLANHRQEAWPHPGGYHRTYALPSYPAKAATAGKIAAAIAGGSGAAGKGDATVLPLRSSTQTNRRV